MTPETTLSILHQTGDLLSSPANRCVGTLALDDKGRPVSPTGKKACRWCLTGALHKVMQTMKVTNTVDQVQVYFAVKDIIGLEHKASAPIFWDSHEELHAMIADRLRKAE